MTNTMFQFVLLPISFIDFTGITIYKNISLNTIVSLSRKGTLLLT